MKRFIVVILMGLVFLLTTAQSSIPKDISGFEILEMRVIYKISQRIGLGDCTVTHYWWVDEWGRIVDEENYVPDDVLSKEEMLKRYFEFIFPPQDDRESQFHSFDETGA